MQESEAERVVEIMTTLHEHTRNGKLPVLFKYNARQLREFKSLILQSEPVSNSLVNVYGVSNAATFKSGLLGELRALQDACGKLIDQVEQIVI